MRSTKHHDFDDGYVLIESESDDENELSPTTQSTLVNKRSSPSDKKQRSPNSDSKQPTPEIELPSQGKNEEQDAEYVTVVSPSIREQNEDDAVVVDVDNRNDFDFAIIAPQSQLNYRTSGALEFIKKGGLYFAAWAPPAALAVNAFCAFPHIKTNELSISKIQSLSPGMIALCTINGTASYVINGLLNLGTIPKACSMVSERLWTKFWDHPYQNAALFVLAAGSGVSAAAVGYSSFIPLGPQLAWANFTTNGFIFFVTRFYGLVNALNRFEKWRSHRYNMTDSFNDILNHITSDCVKILNKDLKKKKEELEWEIISNLLERLQEIQDAEPSETLQIFIDKSTYALTHHSEHSPITLESLCKDLRALDKNQSAESCKKITALIDQKETEMRENILTALLQKVDTLRKENPAYIKGKTKTEILGMLFDYGAAAGAGFAVYLAFAKKFLDGLDQLIALCKDEKNSTYMNELAVQWKALLSLFSIATSILYTGQTLLLRQTLTNAYNNISKTLHDPETSTTQKTLKIAGSIGLLAANGLACTSIYNLTDSALHEANNMSGEPDSWVIQTEDVASAAAAFSVNTKLTVEKTLPAPGERAIERVASSAELPGLTRNPSDSRLNVAGGSAPISNTENEEHNLIPNALKTLSSTTLSKQSLVQIYENHYALFSPDKAAGRASAANASSMNGSAAASTSSYSEPFLARTRSL